MALFSGSAARRIGVFNAMQAQDAEKRAGELLGQAKGDALGAIGTNFDRARGDLSTQYTGAIDRLNPWATAGTNALATYEGSLGQGGQAARDAAVAQFQATPGYQWQQDQAADQIARKQSSLGALGSGNTMVALQDRAQNIANQEYGGWQDRLQGLSDRGQQAATTQAGLQGQLGAGLAGLGQSQGQLSAGVHTGLAGLGLNNIWQSQGLQSSALSGAQKQAQDNVNSGYSFGANLAGAGINLLGMGMGGGNTLGGNLIKSFGA
jgi:hypothetical protein